MLNSLWYLNQNQVTPTALRSYHGWSVKPHGFSTMYWLKEIILNLIWSGVRTISSFSGSTRQNLEENQAETGAGILL